MEFIIINILVVGNNSMSKQFGEYTEVGMYQEILLARVEIAVCDTEELAPLLEGNLYFARFLGFVEPFVQFPETLYEDGALISKCIFDAFEGSPLRFFFEDKPV
jgi:hypothetical protein